MFNPNEKLASVIKLQNLTPDQGIEILGQVYSEGGQPFAPVGDINQDGTDDFLVAASSNGGGRGEVFLIWGGNYTQSIDLTQFQPSQGVVFAGEPGFNCGVTVAALGKVNRDMIPDFMIGCPQMYNNTGAFFIVYGRSNFPARVYLASLAPSEGAKIVGEMEGSLLGYLPGTAADFTRDSWADIVLSTFNPRLGTGTKIYILYGGDLTGTVYLNNVTSTQGILLQKAPPAGIGYCLKVAGNDVNAKNPILMVSDPAISNMPTDNTTGSVYVVSNISTLLSPVDLETLDAAHATVFLNYNNMTSFGFAFDASLDISGNIKEYLFSLSNRGSSYFGKWYLIPNQGLGSSVKLVDLSPNQYTIIDSGTWRPSFQLQWLADLTNDGQQEFVLNAGDYKGVATRVYLLNRGVLTINSTVVLDSLTAAQGVIFEGPANNSRLGESFSPAGDIDHDGLQDLLIKQRGAVGVSGTSKSHLLYGKYLRSLLSMSAAMPSPSTMAPNPISVTSVVSSSSATTTKVGDTITTVSSVSTNPVSGTPVTTLSNETTTKVGDTTSQSTQASTTQTPRATLIPVPATSAAHRNTPLIGSLLSTLTGLLASPTTTFSAQAPLHQSMAQLMPENAGQYVQPNTQNTVPDVASTILLGRVLWEIGKNSVGYIREKLSSAYGDSDAVQSTKLDTRPTHTRANPARTKNATMPVVSGREPSALEDLVEHHDYDTFKRGVSSRKASFLNAGMFAESFKNTAAATERRAATIDGDSLSSPAREMLNTRGIAPAMVADSNLPKLNR